MNRRRAGQLALIVVLVMAAALGGARAWCQSPADASSDWQEGDASATDSVQAPARVSAVDLVGKLVAVLALGWGGTRAVRWWQGARAGTVFGGAPTRRLMCVEETLSLGADGRLHLLAVDGRRLLLAGTAEGLRQLADLTPPPEDDTPSIYRSRRQRSDGGVDELNILRGPVGTRPLRADLARDCDDWHARRDQLLRELQES